MSKQQEKKPELTQKQKEEISKSLTGFFYEFWSKQGIKTAADKNKNSGTIALNPGSWEGSLEILRQ